MRLPVPTPVGRARPRRGRLPHRRHQGRRRGPLGRDGHRRAARPRRAARRATATRSRWCSAGCTRSTATTSRTCARRSRSCRLNDASFTYEPETSGALGFGFRCGFLGLLHMEIVARAARARVRPGAHRHRAERRVPGRTAPTARVEIVDNPADDARRRSEIDHIEEPYFKVDDPHADRVHRARSWSCARQRRGEMEKHGVPVARAGRAHLPHPAGRGGRRLLRPAEEPHPGLRQPRLRAGRLPAASNLVKVDVLLNGVPVDAFSTIVHRDQAYDYGRRMTEKLRELIPRQMFDVPIQAAIGGRIIARETVKAKRKDVLAKCYGGDITRKRKLLEKQKEGKKKMKTIGRVEVPQEAFISALRLDD